MDSVLRLVHSSDLHLGCDFLPAAEVEAGVRALIDAALERDAHALLLPGDLVDHNRVSDGVVEFLVSELARFGRHSFILPGNHDVYDDRSIYHREVWKNRPPFIHFVDSDSGEECVVPELGLEVWGRPVREHDRSFRPLEGVPARAGRRWRVALAHGHFERPGEDARSSPIFPDHIAAADCDYVALGHWDRQADVSQGGVTAYYSGAPHGPIGRSRALFVTLDPGTGALVETLTLSTAALRP